MMLIVDLQWTGVDHCRYPSIAPTRHAGKDRKALSYLRLDQNQINKQHDVVMFDVFIREPFTIWTLR